MRKKFTGVIALATVGVMIVAAFEMQSAKAGPAKRAEAAPYANGDIEVSSQRRRYRRSGGAEIGAFLAVVGSVAAIAAANSRREYYYPAYGYGYGLGPYGPDYNENPYEYGYNNYEYGPGYVVPPVYGPGYQALAPRVYAPHRGRGYVSRGGGGGGGGGHARGGGGRRR